MGAPLLTPAVAHFPQYRLRGVFHAERGGIGAFGVGVESVPIEFLSTADLKRFGVELSPDQIEATRVRIMLVDAAKRARGAIEIDASGNGVLTLANFDGAGGALASVTLESDGTIRLAPASGAKVVIAGDLETDRIRYLPSGGGFHQNLP
jgi:hypothetical protein